MKKLIVFLLVLGSCSSKPETAAAPVQEIAGEEPQVITDPANQLESKVQKLELRAIGISGPIWISAELLKKYENKRTKPGEMLEHCIYIEPADSTLIVPESFDPGRQKIVVEGQFYVHNDYPKGTIRTEDNEPKARVFRYSKLEVVAYADPNAPQF